MDITSLGVAIAGLKNAFDLTKLAIAARDEQQLVEARQAVNDRIIDVQNAALALQEKQSAARDEIDELKEALRTARTTISELESAHAERDKYALAEVGRGTFVYALKEEVAGITVSGEPRHYLCQPCLDGPAKRKVVLTYNAGVTTSVNSIAPWWTCPVCKHAVSEQP